MTDAATISSVPPGPRRLRWIVLCGAMAMSVGWGLRGFIGGGSFGAMIPGALIALVICRGLGLPDAACARIAAFGAVGIGFGGQETYGQTVRFVTNYGEMFARGLAGLTVKGAVWGFVGGAVLGVALMARRVTRRDLGLALAALVAGTWLGWRLIDEPKLLYFSNLHDKPRAELWAGLLTGGLAFLGVLAWRLRSAARVPWVLALAGLIGGGIGFGVGGALYAAGMRLGFDARWYPGWKQMEFTFGLCFGAALAFAAYQVRDAIRESVSSEPEDAAVDQSAWWPFASVLLAAAILWASGRLPLRFDYTVGGATLLALAWWSRRAAWQIALTITVAAFALDVGSYFTTTRLPDRPLPAAAVAVLGAAAVSIAIARREARGGRMAPWATLLLLWTAIAAAGVRTALARNLTLAVIIPTVIFFAGGAMVTLMLRAPRPTSSP